MFQFNSPAANTLQTSQISSSLAKPFGFSFGNNLTQPTQPSALQASNPSSFLGFANPFPQNPISTISNQVGLFQQSGFNTIPPFGQTSNIGPLPTQPVTNIPSANFQQLYLSFTSPAIFNDVKDQILQQWNQFQALAGKGKGYYSPQLPPIDYTPDGLIAKFKTICYNNIVSEKNEDGVMLFISNKSYEEVYKVKLQLADGINRLLGYKPNVNVEIIGICKLADNQKCCLTLMVVEKLPQGVVRKATCTDLMSFFNITSNAMMKSQLESLSIENIMPKVGPTSEQLQLFLKNPPLNINPKMWNEAIAANPDPTKLIPVPVYGFAGLNQRLNLIKTESTYHQARMEDIRIHLSQQMASMATIESKIFQVSRRYRELRHRLIKARAVQDVRRLSGLPIQMFEVQLRSKLEAINRELTSNDQIQGLWQDIRAQKQLIDMRSKSSTSSKSNPSRGANVSGAGNKQIPLEPLFVKEYKEFVTRQQECLDFLVGTLKNDARDLEYIQNTLAKSRSSYNETLSAPIP